MNVRVLLVEDEPIARDVLRMMLAGKPGVEIAGECTTGRQAQEAIRERRPDIVFLDIRMPDRDGFDVLKSLPEAERPVVVCVTAYNQYALRAFDAQALDYLLKPFDQERFDRAFARAVRQVERIHADEINQRLRTLLNSEAGPSAGAAPETRLTRLAVRKRGATLLVRVEEIDWFEAAGDYVSVHTGGQEYLVHETMAALEARLDPARFLRIHRSAIVNVDRVHELHPCGNGEYRVALECGASLKLSRNYHGAAERLLHGAA
jgi:two-component system LytT family response regulator